MEKSSIESDSFVSLSHVQEKTRERRGRDYGRRKLWNNSIYSIGSTSLFLLGKNTLATRMVLFSHVQAHVFDISTTS